MINSSKNDLFIVLIKAIKKKIKITKFKKCLPKFVKQLIVEKDRTYYRFFDILELYSINKKNR